MSVNNFIQNIIGGFALGILAGGNSFGCCCSCGGGAYSSPSDSFFSMYSSLPLYTPQMPPMPDFTAVGEAIKKSVTDMNSPFNKHLRSMYDKYNEQMEKYKEQAEKNNSIFTQSQPGNSYWLNQLPLFTPQFQFNEATIPFMGFTPSSGYSSFPMQSFFGGGMYPQYGVTSVQEKKTDDSKEKDIEEGKEEKKQVELKYDAKDLKSKWSKKQPQLTDEFYNKIVDVSKKVKCNPEDLMALINLETAQTFSPSKRCSLTGSTATGLIQFVESTAKGLGTTTAKLSKMTAVQQLDYVEKYLINSKKGKFSDGHTLSAGDLYALVAQPANADKEVLIKKGSRDYAQNKKSWDLNGDGQITKTELGKALDPFRA